MALTIPFSPSHLLVPLWALSPISPSHNTAGALTCARASGGDAEMGTLCTALSVRQLQAPWPRGQWEGGQSPATHLVASTDSPFCGKGLPLDPGADTGVCICPSPSLPARPPPLTGTSRLHIISTCIFITFPLQDIYLNLLLVNITTGDANKLGKHK